MANFTFRLVENADQTGFSLCTVFRENSLDLTVFQGNSAWKSTIEWKEIETFAARHKVSPEDFFAKLKDCIEQTVEASPRPLDVDLSFSEGQFAIVRILENDLRLRFFVAGLEKQVNYEDCVNNLLGALYADKLTTSKRLKQVEEALDKEQKDKVEYEAKLVELIRKKNADDAEMYGKFVLVLNEKKREIQHLSEMLDAFRNGRPRTNPVVDVKTRKRKKEPTQKKEVISESGSEDDDDDDEISNYQTSDDSDSEEKQPKKLNLSQNITNPESDEELKPSTSSTYSRFLEDSPPRELLTKKITKKVDVISDPSPKPSPTKPTPPPPPPVDKDEEPAANKPSSPVVDFNTQDLLEML